MCLGTFPHRARSSVTVCAFARYAHPDTRNISFSLNRICSEGNCQVLYRAATGVGSFSYVSSIGSGIMNLFPAVLIEYTKYFVKRIHSMSSKTKIIVLKMKEIIYTALFIGFAIVLIMLFLFMFARRRTTSPGARQTRPPRTPHRPLLPPLHTFRDFIRPPSFWAARTPMWRSQWTVQGSAPYLSCL